MGIAALERRVRALEQALLAAGKQCNCRTRGQTNYHNSEELKNLMEISCPRHNFRELGSLRLLPSGLPLQPDDRNFCSCPPCQLREFLQGQRGPLTEAEQESLERMWEEEFGAGSGQASCREQARLEALLRKYEHNRRNSRRDNG